MTKWLLALVLCLHSISFGFPLQNRTIEHTALEQLTSKLGIPEQTDLVFETQKRWLRKPGQERWEIAELTTNQRNFVLNWATEQGLYAAWEPTQTTYDAALILGATTCRMQMRLDYLADLWQKGIRCSRVVFLTGDRPLDSRIDSLTDRAATESDAARILWNETILPEELRHLPILFIAVPMLSTETGVRRPNTQDTILAYLEEHPRPHSALFISDQPFCGYQYSVINTTLPQDVPFDVVGQGVNPSSHPALAAITLDSIARWIYQEGFYKTN